MGVDDEVRPHPRAVGEGHIWVRPQLGEHSLLPVPTTELIPYHRVTPVPHFHIHLGEGRSGGREDPSSRVSGFRS